MIMIWSVVDRVRVVAGSVGRMVYICKVYLSLKLSSRLIS